MSFQKRGIFWGISAERAPLLALEGWLIPAFLEPPPDNDARKGQGFLTWW